MNLNTLLITHTDLDAIGTIILHHYYKLDAEIWSTDYKNYEDGTFEYEQLVNYQKIIYVDFTPDKKSRLVLEENNIETIILDHHLGVLQEIDSWDYIKKNYIYDELKCGTKLFYEYLISLDNKPKQIIEYFCEIVNTYDLWLKTSPLWNVADNLNRLLYQTMQWGKTGLEKYSFFIDNVIWKLTNLNSWSFNRLEEGKIIASKKKENEIFSSYIQGKKDIKTRKDKQGHYFSIIKLNSKVSAISNRLLDYYKKLDYIMIINNYNPEKVKVSLRSKEHINLLTLDKTAGHENACGLVDVDEEWISDLWSSKVYCLEEKNKELDNT